MRFLKYHSKNNSFKNTDFLYKSILLIFLAFIALVQTSFTIYKPIAKKTIEKISSKPNIIYILADDLGYKIKSIYQVFNLEKDRKELKNLSDVFPKKRDELIKILENARTTSEYFNF